MSIELLHSGCCPWLYTSSMLCHLYKSVKADIIITGLVDYEMSLKEIEEHIQGHMTGSSSRRI